MSHAASTATTRGVRGQYRNGLKRRRQIVDAAWVVFSKRGYTAASLREIAVAVEVTPAAIGRHFSSKEELLVAVLDMWAERTGRITQGLASRIGLEWFLPFPRLMRFHVDHGGLIELFLTMCTEATDPSHPAAAWVANRYDEITQLGVDNLARAETDGDVLPMSPTVRELEVRLVFAIMDGLELQWLTNPSIDLVGEFQRSFAHTLTRWTGRTCRIVDDECRFVDETELG